MKPTKLLICAHPDDETLFFGGLLLQNPGDFKVICATDANADGRGPVRMQEFKQAMQKLQVSEFSLLGLPDIYEKRLDQNLLKQALEQELSQNFQEVYTHNILGEYGHPHHQDVSFCVHHTFSCPVYSTAYNGYPEKLIHLTEAEFKIKSEILTQIYDEETQRFLNLLPINATEGLQQTSLTEIDTLYNYLAKGEDLGKLYKFAHLKPFLEHLKDLNRPF